MEAIEYKLCILCGKPSILVEKTGWCATCSGLVQRRCVKCHNSFQAEHEDFFCLDCKQEKANEIEEVIVLQRISFARAQAIVWAEYRPVCLCCGDAIKHGTPGRHILCSARAECRKVRRRIKYYKQKYGMTNDQALTKALEVYKNGITV